MGAEGAEVALVGAVAQAVGVALVGAVALVEAAGPVEVVAPVAVAAQEQAGWMLRHTDEHRCVHP